MSQVQPLYIGNANDVVATITDPRNNDDPIIDATVTGQMQDAVGANVGTSIAVGHVAAGEYVGTWPVALTSTLTEWTAYKGVLTDAAKGIDYRQPYVAVRRTGVRVNQGRLEAIARLAGLL